MSEARIEKFKFWCNKVLPLVYDDSLSYYEVLCKVVDYLNHLIEDVNYLNEIYAPLTGKVAELEAALINLKNTTNAALVALNERCTALEDADERNYQALKAYVDNINAGIQQHLLRLDQDYQYILTLYQTFKAYSDSGDVRTLQNAKAYTDEKIRDILEYIRDPRIWFVVDPVDGQIKDIQTVIDEFFSLIRWGAFTVFEFDSAGYDCDYIDSIGYTAEEFDYYGRLRFMFSIQYVTPDMLLPYATITMLENYALKTDLNGVAYKSDLIVYNPVTGLQNSIQQVIDTLVSFHTNGNTCTELDALDYTASDYDNLQFTAYGFDFNGII